MAPEKIIVVRAARFVPLLLFTAVLWMGMARSNWWFLSIPFIGIGWVCASPNLNFGNGMLAYLSMLGGFVLMQFEESPGAAIAAGAAVSFYLCALEMRICAKPYLPSDPELAPESEERVE